MPTFLLSPSAAGRARLGLRDARSPRLSTVGDARERTMDLLGPPHDGPVARCVIARWLDGVLWCSLGYKTARAPKRAREGFDLWTVRPFSAFVFNRMTAG